jgi:hypothetical protein
MCQTIIGAGMSMFIIIIIIIHSLYFSVIIGNSAIDEITLSFHRAEGCKYLSAGCPWVLLRGSLGGHFFFFFFF